MGEVTTEEKKVRPWQWPGQWFKDEKFWREVLARALSGIIVLFFGYWAAVWLGYIQSANVLSDIFKSAVTVVVATTTWLWLNNFPYERVGRKLRRLSIRPGTYSRLRRYNKLWLWMDRIEVVLIMVLCSLATVLVDYYVVRFIFEAIRLGLGIQQPLRNDLEPNLDFIPWD
jgi:hypothetical protein